MGTRRATIQRKAAMKFKPTQKQLHAQAQANLGLFETAQEQANRQASAQVRHQAKQAILPVQSRVTMSERREWAEVKETAASTGAYRVRGWEGMNFSAQATFGSEAAPFRNVARCDADGVCY